MKKYQQKKPRSDKPKQTTRVMRAAKRKLEDVTVEKVSKIRKVRQKLQERIEHDWL
jgi:hypothetical protein